MFRSSLVDGKGGHKKKFYKVDGGLAWVLGCLRFQTFHAFWNSRNF